MSKDTPPKPGDAEPKTSAVVANAGAAAKAATTGATTETQTSTDLQITLIETTPTKLVPARVLTDCAFGKANSIAIVPADVAEASSDLDPNEAAVAYAQLLAEKITSQP
jgi:hypothetical protein